MDQDTFGSFAETFARWMGTANFILWMTVVIILWLIWNTTDPAAPDRWPFAFLTLALSLQASYAAPLILLAQNRQEARDRVSLEHDREVAEQSRADMDFLAREIASLRMRMNDVATRDFIRSELRDLLTELSEDPEQEKASK
jgi:Predicted membrane protein